MRAFLLPLPRLFLAAALAVPAAAQVQDVGLTLVSSNSAGQPIGQVCGPLGCTPFPGGTVPPGSSRVAVHHAAVGTPFVLAIGLPGPCFQFPGIANDLLLALPPETLAVGVVNSPFGSALCRQSQATYTLAVPAGAPLGLSFRLQSLGVSNSGALAFGPAIELTVQ